MTREEKDWGIGILRGIERGIQIFLQSGEDTITLSGDVETAKMLVAALHEYVNSPDKVPDPETGLMPCGCGGKAEVGDGNRAFCGRRGITTLEHFTQDDAKAEWNRAMGIKEADE